MKIAIITDTHWGSRGDRQALIEHFKVFYKELFFPTLKRMGITTVWHLGDLVDRRKFINYHTLDAMKKSFLDPLRALRGDVHIVLGNHDMYYKDRVSPNALNELLNEYDTFNLHLEPKIVGNITVIPWMCGETEKKAHRLMQDSKTRFCFGHLQIKDFEMDRGRFADEGEDIDSFSKFDAVLTGHFHHKSSYNNIHYLGAPYEMTWKDYDDTKGFHIFDDETGELEFIENPYKLFHKFYYNDEGTHITELIEQVDNAINLKNAFIKVVVKNRNNSYWFDTFIDKITERGVTDLQIVDDHYNLNVEADEDILGQAEDTLTILNSCIDSIDARCDPNELKHLLKTLYDEAQALS